MRNAIEDTIIRYAWAYDENEIDAAVDVFLDGATLEVANSGLAPAVGKEAIRAFLADAREGRAARGEQPRHLVNNVRILEVGAGRATVLSYMTLMVTDADGSARVDCAGTYLDSLVAVDEGWKLENRRISFDRDLGLTPAES